MTSVKAEPSQLQRIVVFYGCFSCLLLAGIACNLKAFGLLSTTMSSHSDHSTANDPLIGDDVTTVDGLANWRSSIESADCIVFLDCEWNPGIVRYRTAFSSFATWCRRNTRYRPLRVVVDPELKEDTTVAVQRLLRSNAIQTGGMKTTGGAGRVLWLRNGRVQDYAWWFEVSDPDQLQIRTRRAFD